MRVDWQEEEHVLAVEFLERSMGDLQLVCLALERCELELLVFRVFRINDRIDIRVTNRLARLTAQQSNLALPHCEVQLFLSTYCLKLKHK